MLGVIVLLSGRGYGEQVFGIRTIAGARLMAGMTRYKNLGGNSNVIAYSIGDDFIEIRFGDGSTYKYTSQSAGASNLTRMKALAERGQGLNAFINTNVKTGYASKR